LRRQGVDRTVVCGSFAGRGVGLVVKEISSWGRREFGTAIGTFGLGTLLFCRRLGGLAAGATFLFDEDGPRFGRGNARQRKGALGLRRGQRSRLGSAEEPVRKAPDSCSDALPSVSPSIPTSRSASSSPSSESDKVYATGTSSTWGIWKSELNADAFSP
jgi:hypothetical protein